MKTSIVNINNLSIQSELSLLLSIFHSMILMKILTSDKDIQMQSLFYIINNQQIGQMPKIWLSLFFGYNGSPFSGMQFQIEDNILTIEGFLVQKLHKAGFLSTDHHSQLQRNDRWSRAARTDKGVHAVINGISCLFLIPNEYYLEDGTLDRNRLHLEFKSIFEGTTISYICFKRVTCRFEIRHMVKSRHYCFVCPKIMFLADKKTFKSQGENVDPSIKVELKPQEQKLLLQKLSECCDFFKGTHNFHNYSKNLKAKDPQSQRYIIDFKVSNLNEDFFTFDIIGQSFIYHQIRKMVGCVIMVLANNYPPSFIQNTFFRNQIHMPLAPAEGLYLNNLNFGAYNKKNDIPEQLDFTGSIQKQGIKKEIEDFITKLKPSIWTDWLDKLKSSIYHGIQYKEEEEDVKIVNDQ